MLIVQKFGGSSLADAERLRRAAAMAIEAKRRGNGVLMVVSAMGESTDELIDLVHKISDSPPARELDALLSCGEQQSAALMAIAINSMGEKSLSLTGWQAGMFTRGDHADADVSFCLPCRAALALKEGYIPVVTGFQGINDRGDITTLGRGGSDTSAVALAAALGAGRCEIYSDVAGIYTADPRLVKDAVHIERMDARDMLVLSRGGSQVLHSKSVELALEKGVELILLSSFGDCARTVLCLLDEEERPDFAGVTRSAERGELTLAGKGCSRALLPEIKGLFDNWGIRMLGGRAGEGYVCVRTKPEQQLYALNVLHRAFFTEPEILEN